MIPINAYKQQNEDTETGSSFVLKREFESLNSKMLESFMQLVGNFPEPNQMYALFSLKQFNAFSIISAAIKQYGKITYCAISSYNISRKTIASIVELCAAGKIQQIDIYVSDVAKSMFQKSYEMLNEVNSTSQNINVFYTWNHSKIALFRCNDDFFVCEGSGNFSYNARHEQYLLINSKDFYEFRRANLNSMVGSGR